MGLLGKIIAKGISTAATNSTIKAVGDATTNIIIAKAHEQAQKDDSVVKNGVLYTKPTRSSEEYRNGDTYEVVQELFGVGFENITLKPIKKLNERATKKYGKLQSISINGKKEFLGIKKIPASSYIVIEFLDFKEDVDASCYANVTYLKSGTIYSVDDLKNDKKEIVGENNSFKMYCSYCGNSIKNEDAMFCSACGKKL